MSCLKTEVMPGAHLGGSIHRGSSLKQKLNGGKVTFAHRGMQRGATELVPRVQRAASVQQHPSDGREVLLRGSVEGGSSVL